jgi:hypothetical protein
MKGAFLAVFRLLIPDRAVTWSASTSHEESDIERAFGSEVRSFDAIDLRTSPFPDGDTPVIVGSDALWIRIETSGAGWICDSNDFQAIAMQIDHFLSLGASDCKCGRYAAHNLSSETLNDPSGGNANRTDFRTPTCTWSS